MKRFKVVSKRELAEIYRVANEDLVISDPSSHKLSAKALQIAAQSHARTQNLLRLWLLKQGSKPFSPNVGHPAKFDLAWRQKGRLCVCEVKSLNRDNEEQQLRLGLGQVLRYQYLMGEHQKLKVDAVLCVECAPTEHKAWVELASRHGVKLIWPQTFSSLLD